MTRLSYLFAALVAAVLLVPSTTYAMPPCSYPDRVRIETHKDINKTATRTGLLSTISVAAPNEVTSITFGTLHNASVTVAGQHYTSGQTLTLPAGTTAVELIVERIVPVAGAFVPITAQDKCGRWPSFVGGGPNAF